jgi:hypothetical protein
MGQVPITWLQSDRVEIKNCAISIHSRREKTEAPSKRYGLSTLDGDPFQPLWYGWAYSFIEPHTLTTVTSFYREAIAAGGLAFPGRYILLTVSEPELRARKQADTPRSRRNFAKHMSLLRHQPRYFATMNAISRGLRTSLMSARR